MSLDDFGWYRDRSPTVPLHAQAGVSKICLVAEYEVVMRLFVIAATLILSPMIAAAQTAPKQAPMFPVPAGSYCPLDAKATLCPAPPVPIPQEDHSNDAKLKQIDDYNKWAAEASRPKVPDEKPLFTPPPTPTQEYHVSVQPPQQGTTPPPIVYHNAPPPKQPNYVVGSTFRKTLRATQACKNVQGFKEHQACMQANTK